MEDEDFNQMIYAIDRAITENQRRADTLFEAGDYRAEIPAGDADNLRKAKQTLLDARSN